MAVENKNVEAAEKLIDSGADPMSWHKNKRSFHILEGTEEGHLPMLKLFVRKGILNPTKDKLPKVKGMKLTDLTAVTFEEGNKFGNTAVHIAIHQHSNNVINDDQLKEILIKNIADINQRNIEGLRPIDLTKHQKTRRVLAAFGANPKGIKASKSELGELQRNYSGFQNLFENYEKAVKQAFAKSTDAEGFADELFKNIILDDDTRKTEESNIKAKFKETFGKLEATEKELEQKNIIKRLVNSILKIFGTDKLNEAVKEEAKNAYLKTPKVII